MSYYKTSYQRNSGVFLPSSTFCFLHHFFLSMKNMLYTCTKCRNTQLKSLKICYKHVIQLAFDIHKFAYISGKKQDDQLDKKLNARGSWLIIINKLPVEIQAGKWCVFSRGQGGRKGKWREKCSHLKPYRLYYKFLYPH